jgi:CDP-diacylglycerol---glycerol-3-phosphate 3-phosphatidyltransferase
MFSRRIQQQARFLVTLLIKPFVRLSITPNSLTVIGLLLSVLTAVVIALGYLMAGGVLVLFAGIFDMFDGAMARVNNTATTFGAFFDSTLDRYSESIILLGLLVHALQRPGLHDIVWPFAHEQSWMIILIFIAVVGSLMVSYTKARAEGLGLECKTGLLARPERVVILAFGLLSGTSIWALILLAVLSQATAIERINYVRQITKRTVQTSEAESLSADTLALRKETSADNGHAPTTIGMNEVREPSVLPVPTSVPPFNNGVHQE